MPRIDKALYRTPFSPSYWNSARRDMGRLNMLVFAALMVAMARALSLIPSIPIAHTRMSFGFLARALCALVCGPVMGLVYGFVEDMLGFMLQPSGQFFFGYTLSTMLGMLVYALCLYRVRISMFRLLLANLIVNVFINAALGTVWTVVMMGGNYWILFVGSLAKNLVTIIPKSIMLYILFQALLPVLQRMEVIPRQVNGPIRFF